LSNTIERKPCAWGAGGVSVSIWGAGIDDEHEIGVYDDPDSLFLPVLSMALAEVRFAAVAEAILVRASVPGQYLLWRTAVGLSRHSTRAFSATACDTLAATLKRTPRPGRLALPSARRDVRTRRLRAGVAGAS
jgi:hypothetical protein